jgi:hypothetical protein
VCHPVQRAAGSVHHLQPWQRFLLRYTVQFLSINSHRTNDRKRNINYKSKDTVKRGLKSHEQCCNSEREEDICPLSTESKRDVGVRPGLQGTGGSFPGRREAAAWRWPYTPFRTEIKKCIDVYLHSPMRCHGMHGNSFAFYNNGIRLMKALPFTRYHLYQNSALILL